MYSLPYVPPEDVVKVYDEVILPKFESILKSSHPDITKNKPGITKFVQYVEHTWVGGQVGRKKETRTIPLFAINRWSQYEAATKAWPRTNNSSEGIVS
jgi:hypothetical protein